MKRSKTILSLSSRSNLSDSKSRSGEPEASSGYGCPACQVSDTKFKYNLIRKVFARPFDQIPVLYFDRALSSFGSCVSEKTPAKHCAGADFSPAALRVSATVAAALQPESKRILRRTAFIDLNCTSNSGLSATIQASHPLADATGGIVQTEQFDP